MNEESQSVETVIGLGVVGVEVVAADCCAGGCGAWARETTSTSSILSLPDKVCCVPVSGFVATIVVVPLSFETDVTNRGDPPNWMVSPTTT